MNWIRVVCGVVLLGLLATGAVRADALRDAMKLLKSRRSDERERALAKLEKREDRGSLLLILDALRDEDARVRARARRALSVRSRPDDVALVAARGARHGHPRVRLASYLHLAYAGAPCLAAHVERALADSDPDIREAAVGLFIRHLGGRDPQSLAAAVSRGRAGRPRAAALLALSARDPGPALELALRNRDDKTLEVRVAALEVLGALGDEETTKLLGEGLHDRSWSVRLTAARALGSSGRKSAVPPLLAALGREGGRLRDEVGNALAALTGVGLPPDPEAWARWWEREKARFEPRGGAAGTAVSDSDSAATFHTIPIRSVCVAFVLDRSRSMRDRIHREDEKTKGQIVEEELRRTLSSLRPPARFLLVSFGTSPEAFTPRPVTASPGSRLRALDWFAKRGARGRTNLFDSLELALAQEEVDTIFLLTDGAPSAGEHQTRTEILSEVARLNRYRKAVIHTVEIAPDATGKRWRGLMAELAARNGGHHARR